MSTISSSVCQNFQSCLDPLPFEPHDLLPQLTPSKQGLSFLWPQKQSEIETPKTEQIYIHPLVKRSSSTSISLEMCTESLGSETGNDIVSNSDDFPYRASEKQSSRTNKPAKNQEFSTKLEKRCNFPPPLTSISGNEGVQVRTHREGGRLVIKAFTYPVYRNYFRAERENGRLKLSLLKDGFRDDDNDENEDDEEGEESVNEAENDYCDDEGDEEADLNGRYWGESNVREDGGKIGCKINGGDWSGGSRCNGERSSRPRRLPSLPYCVAIS